MESRKLRLYGENACPAPQPNSSGWDLGQDGKLRNGIIIGMAGVVS